VQTLPDPGALPVAQPPPAGDRAAAAELTGGQQPPGDAGAQLEDDAGQAGALVDAGSAAVAGWWGGQQGWMACQSCSGTKVSVVVVMAADHAQEQSEQQQPAEGRKHALITLQGFGRWDDSVLAAGLRPARCWRCDGDVAVTIP
jgi:hypothetical protein